VGGIGKGLYVWVEWRTRKENAIWLKNAAYITHQLNKGKS